MTLVLSRPSSTGDEDVVVQRSRLQEHGSPGYLIKQNLRLYSPSADEPCSSSSRAPRASQAAKLGPLIHLQGTKLFVSSSPRPKETMPQLSSVVPALDGRKALSRCTLCLSLRVGHVLPSADPRIVLSSSSSVSRMDDAPETVMKGAKDFRTAQAPSLACVLLTPISANSIQQFLEKDSPRSLELRRCQGHASSHSPDVLRHEGRKTRRSQKGRDDGAPCSRPRAL
ncbi:hypothetical protein L227DRAFT_205884 [Lentinus tigrinus ALCF2SS1-6]|uniref:Uncharacterized protein n=1 Tax=Lentinus tigrinus ALCF2SS1-6 TaxID=1328759 RepID=A0A5C2SN19_9APHY|nr:hypothetical protein L227DRAFT_205884 [Lentinus tigrinus ALCF2SS1-6]